MQSGRTVNTVRPSCFMRHKPLNGGIGRLLESIQTQTPAGILIPGPKTGAYETSDYSPTSDPWRVPMPVWRVGPDGKPTPIQNRQYFIRCGCPMAGAQTARGVWQAWEQSRDPSLHSAGQIEVSRMTEREYMATWKEAKRYAAEGRGKLLHLLCKGEKDNPVIFTLVTDTDENYWQSSAGPGGFLTLPDTKIDLS